MHGRILGNQMNAKPSFMQRAPTERTAGVFGRMFAMAWSCPKATMPNGSPEVDRAAPLAVPKVIGSIDMT